MAQPLDGANLHGMGDPIKRAGDLSSVCVVPDEDVDVPVGLGSRNASPARATDHHADNPRVRGRTSHQFFILACHAIGCSHAQSGSG